VLVHNPGSPIGAKTALAGTHPQAQITPQVVDNVGGVVGQMFFDLGARD